jgi:hypothetical protein
VTASQQLFVAQHLLQNESVHGREPVHGWTYTVDPPREQPVDDHPKLDRLPLGRRSGMAPQPADGAILPPLGKKTGETAT